MAVGPQLDLTPYGIPHVLKPGFDFASVKQSELRKGSRQVDRLLNTVSFTLGKGAGVKYKVVEVLGEGTYGIAYRVSAPDGREYALKFIKEKLNIPSEFQTFLRESVIQILVVDASKGKANGPYAPHVYDICYNSTLSEGYIRSELMKNKLDNLIASYGTKENDAIIPDAFKQVAIMIGDLQGSLKFNHRDMKGDNIMYVRDGAYRRMRLIDFGMACITWHGMKISGSLWFDRAHSCFKKDRDMAQLIFTIVEVNWSRISVRLYNRLQTILQASVGGKHDCDMLKYCPRNGLREWKNIYDFADRGNIRIPAADPDFLEKNMDRFMAKKKFLPPIMAVKALAAAAPPVPAHDPAGICPPGKHRNPVTGRCVKDAAPPLVGNVGRVSVVDPVKACPAGKIYNPKTRRCVKATGAVARHIGAIAALLPVAAAAAPAVVPNAGKPCPPGKVLNPATRRCIKADGAAGKKIVVAAAPAPVPVPNVGKPCPPGKVYNPATRRCNKEKAAAKTRKARRT